MATIDIKKFSNNLTKVIKEVQGEKYKKLYLDVIEPMVYQYVLRTRFDTGASRTALGLDFAGLANSSRILKATQYDIEVGNQVYEHWNKRSNTLNYIDHTLIEAYNKGKISISILAESDGLYAQEYEAQQPSKAMDDIRPSNTTKRMPPMHITLLSDIFNQSDLMNITSSLVVPTVAKDIKMRIQKIIDQVEKDLFK